MRVNSLITEIRYQLSDVQGLGYPDSLLLEFINDGLCFIYSLKPEVFAKTQLHQASVGDVQCLGPCCDRLLSIDAITDACGNHLDIVRQGSTKMAMLFDKAPINQHARTVKIKSNVENEFYVHPPIRPDEIVYFRVTCTSPPEPVESLTDEIPGCLHHEALLNYVFYRAYLIESESQTSHALANEFYQKIFQLLNIERATNQQVRESNEQP